MEPKKNRNAKILREKFRRSGWVENFRCFGWPEILLCKKLLTTQHFLWEGKNLKTVLRGGKMKTKSTESVQGRLYGMLTQKAKTECSLPGVGLGRLPPLSTTVGLGSGVRPDTVG